MGRSLKIVSVLSVMLILIVTSVGRAASPSPQGEGVHYVVQADDWLSKLAEKYLGDSNLWPRIYASTNLKAGQNRNLSVIEHPDLIYPGQIIFIPAPISVASGIAAVPAPTAAPIPVTIGAPGPADSIALLCQDQHPALRPFCLEIPIAQVHFDPQEDTETFTCVSRAGLSNVPVDPNQPLYLVPNDGDFDLGGIVAMVKVEPGRSTLIPRWPNGRFDFSADFAETYELPVGEQLEISLGKAFELIKAGELIWTGRHGAPGKAGLFQINPVLRCDPQADFEIEIGPFNP